jgi:N-acetylmuramoyl-L-alanine amidase
VKGYFFRYPPAGSYVEAMKKGGVSAVAMTSAPLSTYTPDAASAGGAGVGGVQTYVIARGDTLSGIAKRHNISVAQLRSANGLNHSNSVIKVGQKIRIPTS